MSGFLKRLITRVIKGQRGFTLIEMIVVVGIIAVLAAVIVPNIGKFIGSGEAGAKKAEQESVQTAMNAMMADVAVIKVTASTSGANSINNWSALPAEDSTDPGALPLGGADGYLQNTTTVYFYCYDGTGQVSAQHEVATACP